MKNKEISVLNLFEGNNVQLKSCDIKSRLDLKDPSGTLKDLVYFGYLVRNQDGVYSRTQKTYKEETRKTEKYEKNYEIVLNKIFTGSFLLDNLGHELINFLKDDNGQRYVYLNPWGKRGDDASSATKFAIHIIESQCGKGTYEVVAVSEIDRNAESYYSKDYDEERAHCPMFCGHRFSDIFNPGEGEEKAHVYSYKASRLFKPRDKRIVIKVGEDTASLTALEDRVEISLMCNPQHDICYADASGKTTYDAEPNPQTDLDVLRILLDEENQYLEQVDENVDLGELEDEQCFSVISDRTNLEDSTSNQIAYFLGRDKNLLFAFLRDFLGIASVSPAENFKIIREKEKNIDLLIKSESHAIVIENKIDSPINHVATQPNANGKYDSQLSRYYEYIHRSFPAAEKHFFVLAPEYNKLTQTDLDETYENGDAYVLKNYRQLSEFFHREDLSYRPLGLEASQLGAFLFGQFVKGIDYIGSSKAKQRQNTAYIRLKQKIRELEEAGETQS